MDCRYCGRIMRNIKKETPTAVLGYMMKGINKILVQQWEITENVDCELCDMLPQEIHRSVEWRELPIIKEKNDNKKLRG